MRLTHLSVWHPQKTNKEGNDAPAVVLYLPTGLSSTSQEPNELTLDHLRASINLPLVRINYRIGKTDRFPAPLHDVLAGYDWVLENLLPTPPAARGERSESLGKVAVYGELVGGGLATALALTECRIGEPGVVATAVSNPIVDWLALDEKSKSSTPPESKSGGSPTADTSMISLRELQHLRSQVFAKPSHYFDPFASPLLFFRSAGVDASPDHGDVPQDNLEHLLDSSDVESEDGSNAEEILATSDNSIPPAKRRASRRFPSKKMGLQLPSFYISASEGSPLTGQAIELAHHLRASFVRQRKNATAEVSGFGRKVLVDGEEDQLTKDQKATLEAGIADGRKNVRLDLYGGGESSDDYTEEARMDRMMKWMNTHRTSGI